MEIRKPEPKTELIGVKVPKSMAIKLKTIAKKNKCKTVDVIRAILDEFFALKAA